MLMAIAIALAACVATCDVTDNLHSPLAMQ